MEWILDAVECTLAKITNRLLHQILLTKEGGQPVLTDPSPCPLFDPMSMPLPLFFGLLLLGSRFSLLSLVVCCMHLVFYISPIYNLCFTNSLDTQVRPALHLKREASLKSSQGPWPILEKPIVQPHSL
jgi:hypothetical protein